VSRFVLVMLIIQLRYDTIRYDRRD